MNNPSPSRHIAASAEAEAASPASQGDDWQRRFGVPWDRVDRAARAVLERAAAASSRRYSDLRGVVTSPGTQQG